LKDFFFDVLTETKKGRQNTGGKKGDKRTKKRRTKGTKNNERLDERGPCVFFRHFFSDSVMDLVFVCTHARQGKIVHFIGIVCVILNFRCSDVCRQNRFWGFEHHLADLDALDRRQFAHRFRNRSRSAFDQFVDGSNACFRNDRMGSERLDFVHEIICGTYPKPIKN
jgi:hypothetical protein